MKSLYLPLILFILLVFESTAVRFLPESIMSNNLFYIPHWILIFSLLILLFYDQAHTYHGLINGIVFGLLVDLVYTDLLGIYFLAYGVSLYLVHLFKKVLQQNFFVTLLLGLVVIVSVEFILFTLYTIVGQIDMAMNEFIQDRLIPTTLINLLFLLIIYPFFSKLLLKWQEQDLQIK
ncbi:rod shape-determining protein MreD [Filobacillus milosensis]|uniref:rod shape-determining protein MreD n=1 Tax=Filobacillus milosensis TaxID=94137 RepID=UPI001891C039|nr:rod shape-determining protein MreD [Filobacillus milosensis]